MSNYNVMRRRENPQPEKTYELPDSDEFLKTKRVLILEDDAVLADILKEAIEGQGYVVTVVSNGAEGLKKILADEVEVILCDMVMPNFPGDMFYRAVECARPHLCSRFIFMTGHQGDRKIEQFIRTIKGLMLWKPFEMHVLFDAIQVVNKKTRKQD
ncbi:MAG TPA: response regulator [Verrucomicrobiae bacterium]|nr:response regulator [Verrucomicrobiae bacterium]